MWNPATWLILGGQTPGTDNDFISTICGRVQVGWGGWKERMWDV